MAIKHECGCKPCVGQCTSPEAKAIMREELVAQAREAKDALFDFWLYSRPVGHGCSELIRANYGPEHPMAGDCRYCYYGRMHMDQRRDEEYRLQNAWADAEKSAQEQAL